MSDESAVERALGRERKARKKAEALLEDKTRELFLSNQSLQEQNDLLNDKNKELELFYKIVKIAEENTTTTHKALQYYINAICELSGWPVGHIFDIKEQNDNVEFISTDIWYLSSDEQFKEFVQLTNASQFSPGEGLPGVIYEKQKAFWVEDIFEHSQFPRAKSGQATNLHGAFGIPITRYGKIIAIAEFFSENTEKENPYKLNMAETAALQLSTVLERRMSEQKLQSNYQKLQTTHEKLKSTQTQLLQSSKLASIGQLAAGVAHEINNPIAFVANNTNVLKKYMIAIKAILEKHQQLLAAITDNDALSSLKAEILQLNKKKNLDFIMEDIDGLVTDSIDGMERVAEIVSGLKSFARVDEAEVKQVSINECLDSTIKIIWNEIKYKCKLDKEFADIPLLHCHPSQLNQVFMNLIVNAGQAIEEDGVIGVKTSQNDTHIIIKISDTGCGIPQENIDKLYDPFFTTKPVGVGTGLGLSISYGIIQKHNGDMSVDSTPGKGTTFTISLPKTGISAETK